MGLYRNFQTLDGEENSRVKGFQISYLKQILSYIGVLLSGGLFWIIISWKKSFYLHSTHIECELDKADKILLVDNYGQEFVLKVENPRKKCFSSESPYFYHKKMKYSWNEKEQKFCSIMGLEIKTCSDLQNLAKGLSSAEAERMLQFYGSNSIRIEVMPVIAIVLREICSPFYMYQSFIVIIWILQLYYQFAICIIILSIISVSSTVWETRKQSRSLRNAMRTKSIATVVRNGKEVQVDSEELVPGDILLLSQSLFTMFCDAVLLSGNCVVNESMLTGESTPITKVPIPECSEALFDAQTNKRNILSCGTEILLSRSTGEEGVRAIVYRTGFSTAKGELIRSILFPKPVKLKLYSDLLKCMIIFFILGTIPVIYSAIVAVQIDAYTYDALLFVLNVVTFFVPPSLPAVLTSINEQAQRRLRKQGIYCLNSRYINFSGSLDVVCFDKTGTLTEDNLDILAVVPSQNKIFGNAVLNSDQLPSKMMVKAFATCHSLARIDGELRGYDLDIKMFKATGWDLREPTLGSDVPFDYVPPRIVYPKGSDNNEAPVAIVKQFPFESHLKRMSVITQTQGNPRLEVFLKGGPELVISLSQKETVPDDAKEVLEYYSSQGFRIIAVAFKSLPDEISVHEAQKLSRSHLENDLNFLGLVVLENKLMPETVPALNMLKDANIRSVMVTGDNLLTSITVAKKCGMVEKGDSVIIIEADLVSDSKLNSNNHLKIHFKYANTPALMEDGFQISVNDQNEFQESCLPIEKQSHIALDGETFNLIRMYDLELLDKIVMKGAVFARMLPEHKLYLIECLQNLGYHVGMCGDGANDCGALKTAHTGVSLSMAEASVAAPFTATQQNIQCIPTLIREGRATLVSTFDSFRYMVCYTFTFLLGILFLFWDGQRPSDGGYVIIDILLNLAPPFLFGATTAYHKLHNKQPPRSILSLVPSFSVISFMFIQIAVHTLAYRYCLQQPWYVPFTFNKEDALGPEPSYSGTTILTTNMMAYVTAATIFASGPPFRNTFFSNRLYVCILIWQFLLVAFLTLYPPEFIIHFLNFKRGPIQYHLTLYAVTLGVMVFCFFYEKYFVQRFLSKCVVPAFKKWRGPVRKYEKLEQDIRQENWPPVDQCRTKMPKVQLDEL